MFMASLSLNTYSMHCSNGTIDEIASAGLCNDVSHEGS